VWRDGLRSGQQTRLIWYWPNTSTFTTLAELLACIERTFGDLDGERMAHPKMTPGMMANDTPAKSSKDWFSMRRPLEDAFIWGFEAPVNLFKVYPQMLV